MIKINLLPFRSARKKENIRRQISIYFLSLVLVLIGLVYYDFSLSSKVSNLETAVNQSQKELKAVNKKAKAVDGMKKKLATLNKKIEVIQTLEKNRKEPVILLSMLTDVMIPKRMWVDSFSVKGNKVNLVGIALDNRTVADFMVNLEKTKLFSRVNLKKISKTQSSGLNVRHYQIECVKAPVQLKKKSKNKA